MVQLPQNEIPTAIRRKHGWHLKILPPAPRPPPAHWPPPPFAARSPGGFSCRAGRGGGGYSQSPVIPRRVGEKRKNGSKKQVPRSVRGAGGEVRGRGGSGGRRVRGEGGGEGWKWGQGRAVEGQGGEGWHSTDKLPVIKPNCVVSCSVTELHVNDAMLQNHFHL